MASPIAGVGLGASIAGTFLSAAGAKQTAQAQQQMYGYQAGIADLNRQISLENRDYSLNVGDQEAQRFGIKARQTAGSIVAKQGASGIDVGSGSSVAVQKGQKTVTDLDMATIRNNAARKAFNYQVEADTAGLQSQAYKAASANAGKAGDINVAASLISGASSVSSKWLQGNQHGLWGSSSSTSTAPLIYGPGY